MLSLQKLFSYQGDINSSPYKEMYLKFELLPENQDLSAIFNAPSLFQQKEILQDLQSNVYQIKFPVLNFLRDQNPDKIGALFFTPMYFENKLHDYSFTLNVSYTNRASIEIGSCSFEAILLSKYIPEIEDLLSKFRRSTHDREQQLKRIAELFDQNACFINKGALDSIFASILIQQNLVDFSSDQIDVLFQFLKEIIILDDEVPKILNTVDNIPAETKESLDAGIARTSLPTLQELFILFKKDGDALFDFPLSIPEIKVIQVAGMFSLKTADASTAVKNDLYNYDLNLEYSTESTDGNTSLQILHLDWASSQNNIVDNKIAFSFTEDKPIILNKINSLLSVTVKGFDGTLLWSNDYAPDNDELKNLLIEVPLLYSIRNNDSDGKNLKNINKKLRGQILEFSRKCKLKDVYIVIQAKNSASEMWRIVGSTKSDTEGNFSMPYPFGTYVAAQAIVSLTPDAPADILTDSSKENFSISDDFLYLLIKDPECTPDKDEDCNCHDPKKAARLPDHADLINSDEYSQDIGSSCLNLSTPNRTLAEHSYQAIVRTSDPDVSNYVLTKNGNAFALSGNNKKIKRKQVDLDNPILWQDAPDNNENLSFYQAVTVATGHVLHYKSQFKADGYSLGELLYSLPLAPGQKKEIVIFDNSHSLSGSESQVIRQTEGVAASIINDREITNQLGGNINESLRGSSNANTSGISAGAGVGALIGPVGAVIGVSGGASNSNSTASQDSSRTISEFFGEKLRNSIMQNAEDYRQLNASVVTTVQEGQRYAVTSEVVANHNHCHALTMMYFEVLRHYAVYQELSSVEECIFVPLLMTNFTAENIYKWNDVLAQYLLPVSSNTYLNKSFGFAEHPLLKAFDANERIKTNYAFVDFPPVNTAYDSEQIKAIKGEIYLRVNLERPKTRYDRIKSLPVTTKTTSHQEVNDPVGNVIGGVVGSVAGSVIGSVVGTLLLPGLGTAIGALLGGGGGIAAGSAIGSGGTKTVIDSVELVKQQIFDSFMVMDDTYQTVPPAQCIRIKSFSPIPVQTLFGPISVSGPDFFDGGIVDKNLWQAYASLLGYGTDLYKMLDYYFAGRLISEWDDIFYNDIIPVVFENIIEKINISSIAAKLTNTTRYKGGERVIKINLAGSTTFKRKDFNDNLKILISDSGINGMREYITLEVETINLYYSTKHFNGTLFSGYVGENLLSAPAAISQGIDLYIPETNDEQRDPRLDDIYLVNKLIEHLNCNLEYYNKILWYKLDADRRFMLLDGFNIQIFNAFGVPVGQKSLSSIVKNELVTITGNSLVFPVAAGYKVSRSYIAEKTEDGYTENVSLFDHYKPLTPIEPYRISVPSRGVFAEAVQGACDACEKVEENTSQDWTKFNTDEPTSIAPVTTPTPQVTDWKAAFKDFTTPIVNIQNAPTSPDPGAGLASLSALLGKSDVFKDITGLDANQQNAIKTYLSNQENAKAFASMAKDMAMQSHNTDHSDKIMDSLNSAKGSGAISQDDYSKLVKEHLQQQIDGGESQKAALENAKKGSPSLSQAAIAAASKGQPVKASKTDTEGNSESIDVGAKTPSANSPDGNLQPLVIYASWKDKAAAATKFVTKVIGNINKSKTDKLGEAILEASVKVAEDEILSIGASMADEVPFVKAMKVTMKYSLVFAESIGKSIDKNRDSIQALVDKAVKFSQDNGMTDDEKNDINLLRKFLLIGIGDTIDAVKEGFLAVVEQVVEDLIDEAESAIVTFLKGAAKSIASKIISALNIDKLFAAATNLVNANVDTVRLEVYEGVAKGAMAEFLKALTNTAGYERFKALTDKYHYILDPDIALLAGLIDLAVEPPLAYRTKKGASGIEELLLKETKKVTTNTTELSDEFLWGIKSLVDIAITAVANRLKKKFAADGLGWDFQQTSDRKLSIDESNKKINIPADVYLSPGSGFGVVEASADDWNLIMDPLQQETQAYSALIEALSFCNTIKSATYQEDINNASADRKNKLLGELKSKSDTDAINAGNLSRELAEALNSQYEGTGLAALAAAQIHETSFSANQLIIS